MTREEVLQRVREYLAEELEVDPARIEEGTRFKEDLEDRYGLRIPDEEAAKLHTVGQVADYVAAHAAEIEAT